MSPLITLALTLLSSGLFVLGLGAYLSARRTTRGYVDSVTADDAPSVSGRELWNRRLLRTRAGRALERQLVSAGIHRRPVDVIIVTTSLTALLVAALWVLLAPVIGLVSIALGYLLLRDFISRARDRRREAFVAQLPDIARVMSNCTSAGLSLPTALGVTAQEVGEPARAELLRVTDALRFGRDLDGSLRELGARVPSRETRVLISTLLVSSRAGGSLIQALRDISQTLETRKETRREIRTTLAQAVATGYFVLAIGVGMLFLLNLISPGSVGKMTTSLIGQIALLFSFGLFALGFFLIRRMTRIEP